MTFSINTLSSNLFGRENTPAMITRRPGEPYPFKAYIVWAGLDSSWSTDWIGRTITITDAREHHNGEYTILDVNNREVIEYDSIVYDHTPGSLLISYIAYFPNMRIKIDGVAENIIPEGFSVSSPSAEGFALES